MATILNAYSLSGGDTTSSTYTSLGECVTIEATTTNINGVNSLIKIQSSDDESVWKDIGQIILGVGSDVYCNDPIKITGNYVRCLLITNDSNSGSITLTASAGGVAIIKSGKFSLNTSQIFNLDTAPYNLASVFPAVAGHFWVILSCQIKYTLNTTPFDIRINIGASTAIDGGGTILFNMNGYISDIFGAGVVIQAPQNDYISNDYLHIGTQDTATTGDGSAIFYITAMLVEA